MTHVSAAAQPVLGAHIRSKWLLVLGEGYSKHKIIFEEVRKSKRKPQKERMEVCFSFLVCLLLISVQINLKEKKIKELWFIFGFSNKISSSKICFCAYAHIHHFTNLPLLKSLFFFLIIILKKIDCWKTGITKCKQQQP